MDTKKEKQEGEEQPKENQETEEGKIMEIGETLGILEGENEHGINLGETKRNGKSDKEEEKKAEEKKWEEEIEKDENEETRAESREKEEEKPNPEPNTGKPQKKEKETTIGGIPEKNERRVNRYFDNRSDQKCYNCEERGHLSNECPHKEKVGRVRVNRKFTCSICLGDHKRWNCPEFICFRCGKTGHESNKCRESGKKCDYCFKVNAKK